MSLDFSPAFARYEALAAEADTLFSRVEAACPGRMPCAAGCGDCCHALFDLSFIEALYLNRQFNLAFPAGPERDAILARADKADREHYRLKRRAFQADARGVSTVEILEELARERIRCPLLDASDRCLLYAHRPITCRLYGAPLLIGGVTRTCGKTGFETGGAYPTVKVERLQDRLQELSQELVASLPTSLPLLGEVLVPVSMALLTDYNDTYLGLVAADEPEPSVEEAPVACDDCGQPADSPACAGCGGATTWVLPGPEGKE